eukprot:363203-Chlamydomonas_euryale.AAC.12
MLSQAHPWRAGRRNGSCRVAAAAVSGRAPAVGGVREGRACTHVEVLEVAFNAMEATHSTQRSVRLVLKAAPVHQHDACKGRW